jgi:hypothetical protein
LAGQVPTPRHLRAEAFTIVVPTSVLCCYRCHDAQIGASVLEASKAVSSAASGASEVERGLSKTHAPLKAAIGAMSAVVQEREAILKGPALRVVGGAEDDDDDAEDEDATTGVRASTAASSSSSSAAASAASAAGGPSRVARASRLGRSGVGAAAPSTTAAQPGRRKTMMGGGARRVTRQ